MNRLIASVLGLAVLILVLVQPASAQTRTVTDAAGRKIEITDTSRIVSIGGSVTEVLYALGLGERVIGVDQTSVFPAAARAKPNVGYMRTLSPEGVLKLAPSLILAIEGSGPPDVIEILERASVPFVLVPEARDAEGVARKIRFIAEATGVSGRGEEVARTVLEDFAAVAKARAKITQRRKAAFVLAMGSGAPIVGGSETSADAILKLAGVDNAMAGFSGFKPVGDESMIEAAPDAVVVMSDGDHKLKADTVFGLPAFASTPAAKSRTLIALPGLYLIGFGPRTAHAAHDLMIALHPKAAISPLPARPWTGGKTSTR
jgi:iron complex transport system substrate-binding protein